MAFTLPIIVTVPKYELLYMVSISVLREICQQMDHFLSILHGIINIVTNTFQNYPLLNVCCLTAAMRMGNTAKFDDDLSVSDDN